MINSFSGLHATYYDLVYGEKPYGEEARFVGRRLKECGVLPPAALLDIACGTGRHAVEFARDGFMVTGADINEALLAQARQRSERAGVEAEFVVQDMCELDLGQARFRAITCLFDSIGYPQTNDRIIATLEGVRRHLEPEGVVAVEFLHAAAMLAHGTPTRVRRWETPEGNHLLRISETHLDVATQTMKVDYELVQLRRGGDYEHWTERQANRFFSVQEMRVLMMLAGLEAQSFVPAYEEGAPIGLDTFHVLVMARSAVHL